MSTLFVLFSTTVIKFIFTVLIFKHKNDITRNDCLSVAVSSVERSCMFVLCTAFAMGVQFDKVKVFEIISSDGSRFEAAREQLTAEDAKNQDK
jgi:hypothetical protein